MGEAEKFETAGKEPEDKTYILAVTQEQSDEYSGILNEVIGEVMRTHPAKWIFVDDEDIAALLERGHDVQSRVEPNVFRRVSN